MDEYKPNSHKSKELPEKRIEKVTSSSAKLRKKSGIWRLTDIFLSDDISNVKSYIFEDVVVPAVKDILLDTVKAFLGSNGRSGRSSGSYRESYRSYYDKGNERKNSSGIKTRYNYDDIILDNRGEAENVLTQMDELIATYGLVSVADFYDLVGVSGSYTDNKYGWTDIRRASVVRVRNGREDGYMIKMPRAMPLD